MVLIYTTCQNSEEAKKIGKLIVEKKFASCVNIWPIDSIYFWENEVKNDDEAVLLIKTIEAKVQQIEDLIMQNHSYSLPFIAVVDVRRVNRAYKEYMSHHIQ